MSNLSNRRSALLVDTPLGPAERRRTATAPPPWAALQAIGRGFVRQWRHRQALKELVQLDDHLLKDMGISRGEALRQAALPFALRWTPGA